MSFALDLSIGSSILYMSLFFVVDYGRIHLILPDDFNL